MQLLGRFCLSLYKENEKYTSMMLSFFRLPGCCYAVAMAFLRYCYAVARAFLGGFYEKSV